MRTLFLFIILVACSFSSAAQTNNVKNITAKNLGLSYTYLDRSYIAFDSEIALDALSFNIFSTVGVEMLGSDEDDIISAYVALGPSFDLTEKVSIFGGLGSIVRAKSGDVAGASDTRGVYFYSQLGVTYFVSPKIGLQASSVYGGPEGLGMGYSVGIRVGL